MCAVCPQATLEAGCKSIDDIVDSFKEVKVGQLYSLYALIKASPALACTVACLKIKLLLSHLCFPAFVTQQHTCFVQRIS